MAEISKAKIDISRHIAHLYFEDDMPIKEIRDRFYKEMGARNVSRILNQGRNKWWRVRVIDDSMHPEDTSLNQELSDRICKNTYFTDAVVVDCIGVEHAQNKWYQSLDTKEREQAFIDSDLLHIQISKHAASYLVAKIWHGDCIGIGSGRACAYTAHFASKDLKAGHLAKLKGVKVFALCGGQHDRRWSTQKIEAFDQLPSELHPDVGAFFLADILGIRPNTPDLCFAVLPVAHPDPDGVIPYIAPHLNDPTISLSMAILGLGTLNGRHHFYDQLNTYGLSAIKDELLLLKGLQQDDPTALNSIGEICHRLFWCGSTAPPGRIREAINKINSKIIAIRKDVLSRSAKTMLVAGGAQKVDVLTQLSKGQLEDVPIRVETTTLVTDSWTAQELLNRQQP